MPEISNEETRLEEYSRRQSNWKLWGPYLSERAWGTVREDYSSDGNSWNYFTHDQSRSRAYRWNEDGLGGISDRNQYLCFAVALWNGKDEILKERLFGLSGTQGNHGEDVKEYYFYLDNLPTHSYMKMLYKYPQKSFPYQELIEVNAKRGSHDFEYELLDTGIFDQDRYFDVFIEYAKVDQEDILIKIQAFNRGPEEAECTFLPTLWFRNTWSWGYPHGPMRDVHDKPNLKLMDGPQCTSVIQARHPCLETYYLYANERPEIIFTENETNQEVIYGRSNDSTYVKDAFHRYIIHHEKSAINHAHEGTKAAAFYEKNIPSGHSALVALRLCKKELKEPFKGFEEIFLQRISEADEFYKTTHHPKLNEEEKMIQRRAFAGMLWSKQLYYYDVDQWLKEDPIHQSSIKPKMRRNREWEHLVNFDVISMPDKWEYPWYACWDLAFHCIPFVLIDQDFAKRQLTLMTREWYMHPNGQLPSYEWSFSDVNPPVLAWAAWRVYKIDRKIHLGKADQEFLKGIFHKLLLNFTWWVNRKDEDEHNIFQGGFLGLDNISVFDRSKPLPFGGHIDQSDGTAWMAFYCIIMMKIALELASEDPIYQDSATKFFEHFLRIAGAMSLGSEGKHSLWDKEDNFFYDKLHFPGGEEIPLKVRSLVGLLPLLAVETLEPELAHKCPAFARRVEWFVNMRPQMSKNVACVFTPGRGSRRIMSILTKDKLICTLKYMLDENEFLSPYGIRSLSKIHKNFPYELQGNGQSYRIDYAPAESTSGLFGGNSNWRGPIWFPINYLIIEALQKHHHYYGDTLKVEFPTGSKNMLNLMEVAGQLSRRLISLFTRNAEGRRPIYGGTKKFQEDPYWRDLILFNEYFHGDNGAGLGASHQTGWTGLVAKLIMQSGQI